MKITALLPWFGSSRMIAEKVGVLLDGCPLCAIPYAGGMCELVHLRARTLLVNDLHQHAINVARTAADPILGPKMIRRLRRQPVSTAILEECQDFCSNADLRALGSFEPEDRLNYACAYFYCAWASRNGTAGTRNELDSGIAVRWEAGGGDQAVRMRSAVESLRDWRKILSRATFTTLNDVEFIAKVRDEPGNAIYADTPFPGPGSGYLFNCGRTDAEQRQWHTLRRDILTARQHNRIVCRFYDHPLIRELYPESEWTWNFLEGRKSTNAKASEVLLVRKR